VKSLFSEHLATILFRAGGIDKNFTPSTKQIHNFSKRLSTNPTKKAADAAAAAAAAASAGGSKTTTVSSAGNAISLTSTKATMLTQVLKGKHIMLNVSVNPRIRASQAFLTKKNTAVSNMGDRHKAAARFQSHRGSDVRIVAKVEPIDDGCNGYDDDDDDDDDD
jgi:hypothetical protein